MLGMCLYGSLTDMSSQPTPSSDSDVVGEQPAPHESPASAHTTAGADGFETPQNRRSMEDIFPGLQASGLFDYDHYFQADTIYLNILESLPHNFLSALVSFEESTFEDECTYPDFIHTVPFSYLTHLTEQCSRDGAEAEFEIGIHLLYSDPNITDYLTPHDDYTGPFPIPTPVSTPNPDSTPGSSADSPISVHSPTQTGPTEPTAAAPGNTPPPRSIEELRRMMEAGNAAFRRSMDEAAAEPLLQPVKKHGSFDQAAFEEYADSVGNRLFHGEFAAGHVYPMEAFSPPGLVKLGNLQPKRCQASLDLLLEGLPNIQIGKPIDLKDKIVLPLCSEPLEVVSLVDWPVSGDGMFVNCGGWTAGNISEKKGKKSKSVDDCLSSYRPFVKTRNSSTNSSSHARSNALGVHQQKAEWHGRIWLDHLIYYWLHNAWELCGFRKSESAQATQLVTEEFFRKHPIAQDLLYLLFPYAVLRCKLWPRYLSHGKKAVKVMGIELTNSKYKLHDLMVRTSQSMHAKFPELQLSFPKGSFDSNTTESATTGTPRAANLKSPSTTQDPGKGVKHKREKSRNKFGSQKDAYRTGNDRFSTGSGGWSSGSASMPPPAPKSGTKRPADGPAGSATPSSSAARTPEPSTPSTSFFGSK